MSMSTVPFAVLGLSRSDPLALALLAGLAATERHLVMAAAGGVVDLARPPFAVPGVRRNALVTLLGCAHGRRVDPAAGARAAAAVELIHLATRYHDAVPGASLAPAGTRQQLLTDAVLSGDLMMVRAAGLAAELPYDGMRAWAAMLGTVHEAKLVGRADLADLALREAAFGLGRQVCGGPAPAPPPAAVEAWAALQDHLRASAAPAALAGR